MDFNDIIDSSPRGVQSYQIGDHKVTLREMSVSQQFGWDELREKHKDDLEVLYCYLIKMCCDEFNSAEVEDIKRLSPKHIIGIGSKIVEMSANDEKKS